MACSCVDRTAGGPDDGGMFKTISSEQIFAPLPQLDFIVPRVFRRGGVALVAGYGASGKSFLCQDFALSAAAGLPWLHFGAPSACRVCYIDLENGEHESRRRFHRLAEGRVPAPEQLMLDLVSMPGPILRDLDDGRFALACCFYDVIFIDTFLPAVGACEENDSSIRQYIDRVQQIAKTEDCLVVMLCHARKGKGAPRERIRGSSAIYDAADSVLFLDGEFERRVVVRHVKSRFSPPAEKFAVYLEDDGAASRFVPVDATSLPKHAMQCGSAILEFVAEHPRCSKRGVRDGVPGNSSKIDAAINDLLDAGMVVNVGSPTSHQYVVRDQEPTPEEVTVTDDV